MKRSDLNFLVDAVAFASFLFMVATGVIMEYMLPAGSGHATTLWGLDRHGWGGIHFWTAVVFLATLAVHVYLHWRWIVAVLRGRPREGSAVRVGLGVTALLALIAIAVAPLLSPIERSQSERIPVGSGRDTSDPAESIQGSMSFGDVVDLTGVTLEELVAQLGLPSDVSRDDKVGQLARDHGFSVADVRTVAARRSGPLATDTEGREASETPGHGDSGGEHTADDETIRGAMTLAEVVAATGVPLQYLLQGLSLPAGTNESERIGRLARTHGFTLVDVREIVASYK